MPTALSSFVVVRLNSRKVPAGLIAPFRSSLQFLPHHPSHHLPLPPSLPPSVHPSFLSIQPCPREIAACEWVPLPLFLSQPRFLSSPLYACVYDLCQDVLEEGGSQGGREGGRAGGALTAIVGTRLEMGFKPGTAWLYHTSQWHHEKHGIEGGVGLKGGNGNGKKGEKEDGVGVGVGGPAREGRVGFERVRE